MLTRIIVRNFKRFGIVDIELGNPVVFIGPNNSGKTAALQALALWEIGVKKWIEKRGSKEAPGERPGVTINRRDLIAIPVPSAKLLWRNLHVRDVQKVEGVQKTKNIRIDIIAEGVSEGKSWKCGLEFDYANEEAFYCRPLRKTDGNNSERMPIPNSATKIRVAFLPPMSGLAANETRLDPGAINVRLGEGRTAEVLRNLCYQIIKGHDGETKWNKVKEKIHRLFGVMLDGPSYNEERAEITMTYRNASGVRLDISASGRGLQQTLLLLAHLTVNPDSILLLDEPDAHLEILRQRQIYQILSESAIENRSQIIIASHSEIILNEAADRDVVVAFLGRPHRIDDRGSQLLKSLKEIGFEQYYQAEQTGWVLYLEGSTDLAILRAFAEKLDHPAQELLERPFVHYVQNFPEKARNHFCGLREAKSDLVGFALFDRIDKNLENWPSYMEYKWHRREIENYVCTRESLLNFSEDYAAKINVGPLFELGERLKFKTVMEECINILIPPIALQDPSDIWWINTKISDEFLDRLFELFFKKLSLYNLMRKTDYHLLARFVPEDQIDPEVSRVMDYLVEFAAKANPIREED